MRVYLFFSYHTLHLSLRKSVVSSSPGVSESAFRTVLPLCSVMLKPMANMRSGPASFTLFSAKVNRIFHGRI